MKHFVRSFTLTVSLAAVALAAPLTNPGPALVKLSFPGVANTGPAANIPGVAAALTIGSGTFSGSWTGSAQAAYQGTFSGSGAYPSGANSGGSVFDFSSYAGGAIAAGISVGLGDLDLGENLTLQAFDSAGALITTAWLDDTLFMAGANPAELIAINLPSYKFVSGVYSFSGSSVPGNPSVFAALPTLQAIGSIAVSKDASFGISLYAPAAGVPEPSSLSLIGLGLAGFAYARNRRRV